MKVLHKGHLYWPETLKNQATYPTLSGNAETEVVIIGGGMSGSICAYKLAQQGIQTVLLERGDIAGGSTTANTGLLQFCNDIMLCDLIDQIGEKDAVLFYKGCAEALVQLGEIAAELQADVGFGPKSSLYVASTEQDLPKLKREYETLKRHGFDVSYWEPEQIAAAFPFSKPGAIVTRGDAQLNPFRFVHAVIEAAVNRYELAVHEHTDVVSHETGADGTHVLRTASQAVIRAKHVIYAIGYEPEELHGQLIKSNLDRTYVIVTEPQTHLQPQYREYFIWETARPYFYMRITDDGRVIAGGYDEESPIPLEEKNARSEHANLLLTRVQAFYPSFDAPIAHEWNATFGSSRDNLPFVGEDPNWSGVYYCLGYGGNGTAYSMMGASILQAQITKTEHPLASIVALNRPSLQNV
ncbi:NAD(P)/FAD-dependent oxidoreductase [Paenibacillus lignilyticus]|uniref:FAD-binding oxidoreductase n=1 Tax=Paenibacillus lignilyticus TaxID=1172615 RepID=A0ABS5C8R0_9BACL|nr:FAD-dependent oxidoreductase [Paenibacillus lignilyticus]MBP3962377.1 FAD-binding oxidoreductase [Paenibacillus lignilyticus]